MNDSTNTLLEQGIQEVGRLAARIASLAEQETAFKETAAALEALHRQLVAVNAELEKLNTAREAARWRGVWIVLGALGFLQLWPSTKRPATCSSAPSAPAAGFSTTSSPPSVVKSSVSTTTAPPRRWNARPPAG
jgi:hypothetical protein